MKKNILFIALFIWSVVALAQDLKKDPKIVTLTVQSYKQETEKGLTLVDYWAVWCGPCRRMEPILKQIAAETDVKVGKLNVDDYKTFARTQKVSTIPTLILYRDGKEVERLVGVYSKDELRSVLNKYILP